MMTFDFNALISFLASFLHSVCAKEIFYCFAIDFVIAFL